MLRNMVFALVALFIIWVSGPAIDIVPNDLSITFLTSVLISFAASLALIFLQQIFWIKADAKKIYRLVTFRHEFWVGLSFMVLSILIIINNVYLIVNSIPLLIIYYLMSIGLTMCFHCFYALIYDGEIIVPGAPYW